MHEKVIYFWLKPGLILVVTLLWIRIIDIYLLRCISKVLKELGHLPYLHINTPCKRPSLKYVLSLHHYWSFDNNDWLWTSKCCDPRQGGAVSREESRKRSGNVWKTPHSTRKVASASGYRLSNAWDRALREVPSRLVTWPTQKVMSFVWWSPVHLDVT